MISHSWPTIGKEELNSLCLVLKSSFLSQGKVVKGFEEKFAGFIGRRYALATNSGTAALHLALLALKLKPKDEVIIPSYVCSAVLNAVKYVNATARIADIDIRDFNISLDSVKRILNPNTKAIIVPHMFGLAADLDGLLRLGVPVIEDCGLSLGATHKNRKVGNFGLISVFSFYATKMMTTAEGGMVVTDNRNIYTDASDLKDYDNRLNYRLRYNYKMHELGAALGLVQLEKLPNFISRRQKIAQMYNKGLSGLKISLPPSQKGHVYFRYVIGLDKNIETFIAYLKQAGIEAKRPIFKPLHRYLGLKDKNFPATHRAYKTALSLPIYPELKDGQVKYIINTLKKIIA